MIHGLDTGFLVAAEVLEHTDHVAARDVLARLLAAGDLIALAPQVLAEFIHVVTDPRRFTQPLDVTAAQQLAEQWWTAREVVRVFPDDAATRQFLAWLQQFTLGRKRLLDRCAPGRDLPASRRSVCTHHQSRGLRGIRRVPPDAGGAPAEAVSPGDSPSPRPRRGQRVAGR